jgi:hypothetical protein
MFGPFEVSRDEHVGIGSVQDLLCECGRGSIARLDGHAGIFLEFRLDFIERVGRAGRGEHDNGLFAAS